MKQIIITLVFLLIVTSISFACYFDSGWVTFTQPNGVKFTARMWGDEYESYFETKEGFSLDKNFEDGYYYYATGSDKGRFLLSNKKVGIDLPNGTGKNLVKKNLSLSRSKKTKNLNKPLLAKTAVTTIYLKILLVEFQDVHGDTNGRTYTKTNFENMLGGSNYTVSPDGETAYGSMKQYYNAMTNGQITINATVMNNSNGDIPIWLRLDTTKNYYHNNHRFAEDVYAAATAANYDLSPYTNTCYVYIYAGNYYADGGLNPTCLGNNLYMNSELWDGNYNNNEGSWSVGYTFAHIGVHCHEFGHTLGLEDIYGGAWHHALDWSLMQDGCKNGNTTPRKSQCPAPIDPQQRDINNWVTVQTPSIPNSGLNLTYNGSNPTIYKINSSVNSYYVENRRYQDYSSFCQEYSSHPGSGGILIWRDSEIIEADGQQSTHGKFGDLWPGSSGNRNIDDFTTVNCMQAYGWGNSNVIIHNISNPGTTMTAIIGNKWFGSIPSSLTFSGPILVGGNLTIPSGLTLTAGSDASFQFDSGTNLTVNGFLSAQGTSSNKITFTRSGGSGTWGGINFQYSGAGTLRYCDISYASTGLQLSMYGEVSNCNIHDNTSCGIYLPMSSAQISNNQIRNNGYYGIYAQNETNSSVKGNIITGHSVSGIYYDLYSTLGVSSGTGSNAIRNNGRGVSFNNNSEAYFGYSGVGGSNSICGNTGYEAYATNYSNVILQSNYWGAYPPSVSEFNADGTSSIDYSSSLGSDPNPSMYKENLLPPTTFIQSSKTDNTTVLSSNDNSFNDPEIMNALQSLIAAKYGEAIILFDSKYRKETSVTKKRFILARLSECYSKGNREGFIDYLNKNIRPSISKTDELYGVTLELEYLNLLRNRKFQDALDVLNSIKENYPSSIELNKRTLYNIGFVYAKCFNDIAKVKDVISELEKKYPEDELVMNSKIFFLGEDAGLNNKKVTSSISTSADYLLADNYPNPFNPTTNISFSLPQRSNVKLVVYDALGKEVTTLANNIYETGKYSLQFNGNNLASGMYFYTLTTSQGTITKKMILVK